MAGSAKSAAFPLSTPFPPKIFLSPFFSMASLTTFFADYFPQVATLVMESMIGPCISEIVFLFPLHRRKNLCFEEFGF